MFRAKGFVFGLGFAVWVECFGFGGLGFWAFWGLGCLGGSCFWVRAERFGAWGFRVLGLAQGFGFRA